MKNFEEFFWNEFVKLIILEPIKILNEASHGAIFYENPKKCDFKMLQVLPMGLIR